MHDALRPDCGIDRKNDKCEQYDAVDHAPCGRVGGDVSHHEDISRDADKRKDGAERHAEGPRRLRQSRPENEYICVRQRISHHPEEAPDQYEVRELRRIRKPHRVDEDHRAADEENADMRRALLVAVHENFGQEADLRHARADIG